MSAGKSAEDGGEHRLDEYILGLIAGIFSLLFQAGGGFFPDLSSFFSLISLVLLVALIIGIIREGIFFVLMYWAVSYLLLVGGLIKSPEFTFNIIFPLIVLFSYFCFESRETEGIGITYLVGIIVIAVISIFVYLWASSNTQTWNLTTTTVTTTTSTSTTSTTTSSTTSTTIQTFSSCLNESYVEPYGSFLQPFTCTKPSINSSGISFNLVMIGQGSLFNITLACSNNFAMPSKIWFYNLQANGTLSQNKPGTRLSNGNSIHVKNLQCMNNGAESFNGYLWVNYTANVSTSQLCDETQIYINVVDPPTRILRYPNPVDQLYCRNSTMT
ncbi:MAG: hypothetical protein KGH62_03035 [Candidatus Micrarchaeota archaeon]|nr:hypothetical protein [Candidatus Micrarchaeota archaeon]